MLGSNSGNWNDHGFKTSPAGGSNATTFILYSQANTDGTWRLMTNALEGSRWPDTRWCVVEVGGTGGCNGPDLVWLDASLPKVLWQLGARSASRLLRRTELWNGNRERLRSHLSLDPGESVLLWAITTHRDFPRRFESLQSDPELAHLRFSRIDSARARDLWLESWA